tara:strand:- start:227 stop:946 length:720 start_codon:yes stop_codon:yes gene_type:complete
MVTFPNNSKVERHELSNQNYKIDTTEKEVVVLLLSGDFRANDTYYSRKNVFIDEPKGFYVANDGVCELVVQNSAEVYIVEHPSYKNIPLTPIDSLKMQTKIAGYDNFQRRVCTILDKSSDLENIIIGETFKSRGNWSSWPPHKHDTYVPGVESMQKEVYLYKFSNTAGFGLQLLYDKAVDDAMVRVVKHNQEVKIDKGYHPVVAAPYADMYYLWVLFGDNGFFEVNFEDRSNAQLTGQH